MTTPASSLPDNILRDLHIAQFAAGFVSPETKVFLEKLEPLLPNLMQDGKALMDDLVRLWPAVAPVFAALAAHVKIGTPIEGAVIIVSQQTKELAVIPDRQGFQG